MRGYPQRHLQICWKGRRRKNVMRCHSWVKGPCAFIISSSGSRNQLSSLPLSLFLSLPFTTPPLSASSATEEVSLFPSLPHTLNENKKKESWDGCASLVSLSDRHYDSDEEKEAPNASSSNAVSWRRTAAEVLQNGGAKRKKKMRQREAKTMMMIRDLDTSPRVSIPLEYRGSSKLPGL